MKTITEYQPLIFSRILGASAARVSSRGSARWNFVVVALYCAAGFWLCVDTGFAPWNWQFWTAFGPLFIAGEIALNEFSAMADARRVLESPEQP